MLDQTAMAVAAKALGFPSVAALIIQDQLGPEAIARLFAVAASEKATKDGAVVVLAGVTARFKPARIGRVSTGITSAVLLYGCSMAATSIRPTSKRSR
jgi:hypothetical protein